MLLHNTQKHGGPHVSVRAERVGTALRFVVEDDGAGFSAEDATRAFEPFVRGRGATPDEQRGVGLGLYLVMRIAQAHGGSAFIEKSAAGTLTRVGFTLEHA